MLSEHKSQHKFSLCSYVVLPAKEGRVLHHRWIREDFGLVGVDIWLKPCQSIGWLSGIDRCAERPTCLFVFQTTGLCSMYSASVNHETPLAKHTVVVLVLLHACVFLIFAVSLPQLPADIVYLCLDSYIYFFLNLVLLLQPLSSFPLCLIVIHPQWLTVELILFITCFDYSHLLCEICLFTSPSLAFILP